MGAALSNIILEAERLAGLQGKLLLAGITRMTTGQATSATDTPQLISQFKAALAEVRGTLKQSSPDLPVGTTSPEKLRRHMEVYLDLMTQRAMVLGDPLETARRVDEVAAETLDVARVSVWMLDAEQTKITCTDLFERAGGGKHSNGSTLYARDFRPYFLALATNRTIAAHDAQTDPRTSCFTQVYLKPLGITSMLDVPVWVNSRMVGVVCHEHLGPARQWNTDEERFAYLMAAFVSLSMERNSAR